MSKETELLMSMILEVASDYDFEASEYDERLAEAQKDCNLEEFHKINEERKIYQRVAKDIRIAIKDFESQRELYEKAGWLD